MLCERQDFGNGAFPFKLLCTDGMGRPLSYSPILGQFLDYCLHLLIGLGCGELDRGRALLQKSEV